MSWGTNAPQEPVDQEDVWLKWPPLKKVYDFTEYRVRILDDEPADVWQHWHEKRPYNCPGFRNCPLCSARSKLKDVDPEAYKNTFAMRRRYYFNVLVQENGEPVVRVFGFGPSVAKKLWSFHEKYLNEDGPLSKYDVSIRQTKTGSLAQNVEYDVLKEKVRELTDDEKVAALSLLDLSQFTQPASLDVLQQLVAKPEVDNEKKQKLLQLEKLTQEVKGITLDHLGVNEDTPISLLDALIESFQQDSSIPF